MRSTDKIQVGTRELKSRTPSNPPTLQRSNWLIDSYEARAKLDPFYGGGGTPGETMCRRLRANADIKEICAKIGLSVEDFEKLTACLSDFVALNGTEKSEQVRMRNEDFLRAISQFRDAVEEFQKASRTELPTINDELYPLHAQEWKEQNWKNGSDFDLRDIAPVSLIDYLWRLEFRIDEKYSAEAIVDPRISTATGRRPSTQKSLALALTLKTLRMVWVAQGALFNKLAMTCANVLLHEHESSFSVCLRDVTAAVERGN